MSYIGRVDQGVLTNNTDATAKMYRVKFQSGQERTMELSDAAVSHYQRIGVQVTPISHGTQLTDVSLRMRNIERNQSQMGIDMTELGKIVTRQAVTDAGYRTELDNALTHRQSNQKNITTNTAKIEANIQSVDDIWKSIEGKADKGHSHEGGGGSCNCEFWDIGCKFNCASGTVGKYAIIAGVGIVAFFLLKRRIGL